MTHPKRDSASSPKSVKPFSQACRVLTCAKCQRTMARAKQQTINGKLVWVCRPCRGEE